MDAQERGSLMHFLDQMVQARPEHKDADAELLIKDACSRQPDALYLLVQRALLLEQALRDAQNRVAGLEAQLAQAGGNGRRFIDANAWGNAPAALSATVPAAPAAGGQLAGAAPASSWGSGFLGNVATTAAGVVAGSFLFQGIEHLLGGRGWSSGLASAQPALTESTVVNNYYELSPPGDGLTDTAMTDGIDATDDWI